MYFLKQLSLKYGNFLLYFLADLYMRRYSYTVGCWDRHNSADISRG